MAYNIKSNSYKQKKRTRKIKRTSLCVLALVLIGLSFVLYDMLRNEFGASRTAVSQPTRSFVRGANITLLRNEYFQFQAPEGWSAVTNDQNDNRITYYKERQGLFTQRIEAYIDRKPLNQEADFRSTHVKPVVFNGSSVESVEATSEHCREKLPEEAGLNPARIIHNEVSFVCNFDSAEHNILVAQKGGDEAMKFTRSDGQSFTLTLVFSDLTAYPGDGDLDFILKSLEIL